MFCAILPSTGNHYLSFCLIHVSKMLCATLQLHQTTEMSETKLLSWLFLDI